jgi:hypothetical protein
MEVPTILAPLGDRGAATAGGARTVESGDAADTSTKLPRHGRRSWRPPSPVGDAAADLGIEAEAGLT